MSVMRTARFAVCAAALLLVQGCASILEGTDQTITVETSPSGANCRFYRQGMVVAQVISPGGAVVEKTKHDMRVECEKEGYETAKANLESGIEGATWGNIILGGGIGWAIDSAAGADNKYPEYVNISLVPKKETYDSANLANPEVPWVWHTVHYNVLAYSEFDGKGRSLQMPTHVNLDLKRQQGKWAIFEYDGKSGARGQGWILMENVEPKL
jgi:hypothetical protein